jgi:hypothetical protein
MSVPASPFYAGRDLDDLRDDRNSASAAGPDEDERITDARLRVSRLLLVRLLEQHLPRCHARS